MSNSKLDWPTVNRLRRQFGVAEAPPAKGVRFKRARLERIGAELGVNEDTIWQILKWKSWRPLSQRKRLDEQQIAEKLQELRGYRKEEEQP